ncbi:MAG: CvpA family protein [Candidatus Kryptoniota bacterium]
MVSSIDIVLGIVLLMAAVHGYSKGFFRKLFTLCALLLWIIIAARYSRSIATYISQLTGFSEIVSGIIGLAVVLSALLFFAHIFSRWFAKAKLLRLWDKVGGLIIGSLEGALLLSLLLLLLSLFNIPAKGPSLERSFLYRPVKNFAGSVYKTFTSPGKRGSFIDGLFKRRDSM